MGVLDKFRSLAGSPKQGVLGEAVVTDPTDAGEAEKPMGGIFPGHRINLFEGIFKGVPDALVLVDPKRRIIMCNPAANTLFGYDSSELLGRRTKILYESPGEYERRGQMLHTLNADEKTEPYTVKYRRRNGETFPGETTGSPIHDDAGNLFGFMAVIRDITGREQAEFELRRAREDLESRVEERTRELLESEGRFRTVVDSSPVGVTLKDSNGKILLINRTFARWMKGEPADFEGKTLHDIFPREQADEIAALDRKTLETGQVTVNEALQPFRDGITRTVMIHKNPILSSGGEPVAVATVITDITERKMAEEILKRRTEALAEKVKEHSRAEEALRISEVRIRSIMENIVESVITIGEDGAIETFNPAAEKMFGYAASEILGENVSVLADEPEASEHDHYIHIYLSTGRSKIIGQGFREVRARRKDGSIFPAELAVNEILEGRRRKFVGTLRDVTERKAAERVLRESEAKLREILQNSPLGVAITTHPEDDAQLTGERLFVNQAFVHMFGAASPEEVIGAQISDSWVDRDQLRAAQKVMRARDDLVDFEALRRRPDGTEWWVLMNARPIRFDNQDCAIVWHIDITERKSTEKGLMDAMKRAKLANRTKTEFLAHMSHELRTPLNAILGYSDILKSQMFGPLGNEKYADYADNISTAGEHLLGFLSDILDVSKVEAGELDIEEGEVDIAEAVAECKTMMTDRADFAKVSLTSQVAGDLPRLLADGRRVRQILLNLLSNAIKFTHEKGQIRLTAKKDPTGAIVIRVEDTGIGIAPEDIAQVLQPFGQVKEAYVSNPGEGSGLGLSLVQSLMDLHGGTLEIHSTPGEGTAVILAFPPERTLAAV